LELDLEHFESTIIDFKIGGIRKIRAFYLQYLEWFMIRCISALRWRPRGALTVVTATAVDGTGLVRIAMEVLYINNYTRV